MKKLIWVLCLVFVSNSAIAEDTSIYTDPYQEAYTKLCAEVPELAKAIYKYGSWVSKKYAIKETRKKALDIVPSGTIGRSEYMLKTEEQVEYMLISYKEKVPLEDVILVASAGCIDFQDNLVVLNGI